MEANRIQVPIAENMRSRFRPVGRRVAEMTRRQGVCIGKRGRSSIGEGTLEEVAGNRCLGTMQRRRPGMPDVVRFLFPVLGPLPPASHRSGVLRWFPILTSVSDDLSAREARAGRPAGGWGRARAEEREAGQRENAPPSASRGQWAPPAAPRLRERYERRSPGKVRAEPERQPDHPCLNNTATSSAARHEPREEDRYAPRDRRRRRLPLQSPEDAGLRERAETQGVQQGAPGCIDR